MTQYVVLHYAPKHCEVSIEPEGREYPHHIETWALRSGKQIQFARMRMARLLNQYHLAGNYDTSAMYALTADEMFLILQEHLGPSDRDRYEATIIDQTMDRAVSSSSIVHITERRGFRDIMYGCIRVMYLLIWRSFRFVLVMVVAAITLGKIGRGHK